MDRKSIILKITNEQLALRQKAEAHAEFMLQKAKADAKFGELFVKKKELEFLIAKLNAYGEDAKKIEQELNDVEKLLKQRQTELGFVDSDFVPHYTCNKCHDTGYVNGKYCSCFKAKLNDELIRQSGLEPDMGLHTFKDFDANIASTDEHKTALLKLKTVLMQYAEKFPASKYCVITISGHTGVGKSFALECLTSEIIKKGFTSCFITAFQLNNQFLKYHSCFDANKQSYLDMLLDPDFLAIDDLGTEPIFKNVTAEYLNLIISERMLKHKATVITTNLNMNDLLTRYGERIFSRITNKAKALNIQISGNDLRHNKN